MGDNLDEAQRALQAAVESHGAQVLSNAGPIKSLLTDLLPDSPRAVSLMVAAAEAGVASDLQDHVERNVDPDTAVRLVADALGKRRALDRDGCIWVAGAFARALGYQGGNTTAGQAPVEPSVAGWSRQPVVSTPAGEGLADQDTISLPVPPRPDPARPGGRRLALLVAAGTIVALIAAIIVARANRSGHTTTSPTTAARATTTSGSAPSSTAGPTTVAPASVATTVTVAGVALGTQLKQTSAVPCHGPHTDSGSSWEIGAVRVGGKLLQPAYYCYMYPAGTGSLDFVLGKQYRQLSVTIGFADDSASAQATVKFELIGDATTYLTAPRTLHFGQTANLMVDVSGITRLTLQVTELSSPVLGGAPSRPVWGNPLLSAP
ncbi:MAG: NPCBM/NEW2 domain-containing protein [Actinomycetota bacterium]|nr:NPCBM/NEW2 domain-containing protein [Actinomycetota bacterium]